MVLTRNRKAERSLPIVAPQRVFPNDTRSCDTRYPNLFLYMTTWNENNLLQYAEQRRSRLLEYTVKDAIKTGNRNLSKEQRDEIYKAFTTKPDAFKKALKSLGIKSGDDLLGWTYEDFRKNILDALNLHSGKNVRTGIEGLAEGKDYMEIGRGSEYGGWVAYILLSFKGAQTIASNRVEPSIHIQSSSGDDVEKATWCTAADEDMFQRYNQSGYLVDFFRFDPNIPDADKKIQATVIDDDPPLKDVLNAENTVPGDSSEVTSFLKRKVVPLVREKAPELEQNYMDSLKVEFAEYLNPTTHRYDVPYDKFQLLMRNGRILLPVGVLSGNGESPVYSLTSLDNFPTRIKNMSFFVYWIVYDRAPVTIPRTTLDNATFRINADLKDLEGIELINGGAIQLSLPQYLDLGVEKCQALIDTMLSQHKELTPYEQVVRVLDLDFAEYIKLKSQGFRFPEVIDWRDSGTQYLYAKEPLDLSNYMLKSLFILGVLVSGKATVSLNNVTVQDYLTLSNLQVNPDNVHVSNLHCNKLLNTTLDGITVTDPKSAVVLIENCPNLERIPDQFYQALRLQITNCSKIGDYDSQDI